ncbi:hypothetical protein BVC80_1837g208 [Macleaya cordata]|uniref:Uncharacterized protein n=1 Tax=Macleaya cordata TaxID=56857 RepID=A0A200R3V9_MACCD|nr:hypothetical protein BVC80_1837g208 [Macleaya cordata]
MKIYNVQIEIRCRGQQLEPGLTLQHVRDNIWNSKEMVTLLPDSSTTDHVMILHYARTSNSSSIINKTTTTTTTSSST